MNRKIMKPLIVGLSGGTGSGKTTIAEKVVEHFKEQILYIPHDKYYRDQSHLEMEERVKTNYDHPKSLETDLLVKHLNEILEGKTVDIPEYDFTHHTRQVGVTTKAEPKPIILIEGILIFEDESLRDLIDLKVFVDVPADIRILRRMQRDVEERGRTFESVIEQYLRTARPMHEKYIEPIKHVADLIIPQGGFNTKGIQGLIDVIEARLE